MFKRIAPLVLLVSLTFAAPAFAANDPTLEQVYGAARSGHLDQAQQMMSQVLRDHPRSAKAHYVMAEIYAKEGNLALARQELSTAEAIEPGLPFARPEAVRALQRELSGGAPSQYRVAPGAARAHSSFPWGWVLVIVGGVAVLWLILRRRRETVYTSYPAGAAGTVGGPVGAGGPMMGGGVMGGPVMGGGSGMLGALGTGLAVGAGVAAGEELVRHVLDDRRDGTYVPPPAGYVEPPPDNANMGGNDFGVSDASSWDDDSSSSFGGDAGGGGGGDDWT